MQKPAIIIPTDPLWLQCSCGHREFAIQGFKQGNGLKIMYLICTRKKCNKRIDIDTNGNVGGFANQGKISHILHKGKVKENA